MVQLDNLIAFKSIYAQSEFCSNVYLCHESCPGQNPQSKNPHQTPTKAPFLDRDQNSVRAQVLAQKQRENFKRESDTGNTKNSPLAMKQIKALKLNSRNYILNNTDCKTNLWISFDPTPKICVWKGNEACLRSQQDLRAFQR